MNDEEKMNWLSTMEYFADRLIEGGREETVRFILKKYETNSFEELNPVWYSQVCDELSAIEADMD